ncbi:MAG: zinc-ribbon domain-containing protein [Ktedonobacteraceae bacterium]|nr:zinc-ribbon domain-containing protein [Ktedonobacteraceae bacterium]
MNSRFYQAPDLDSERIARDLEGILVSQGYQTQHFGNRERIIVQVRQGSDLEGLLGMQAALTLTLQSVPNGIIAVVGQQQWLDKAAVGAIGMLVFWPLIITAGAGALRQATIEGELLSLLDTVVSKQRADVHIGPVPPQMQGFVPPQPGPRGPFAPGRGPQPPFSPGWPGWPGAQQWPPQGAPVAGTGKQCASCGEINEADDRFCSRCGKPLTQEPEVKHCRECQAELKPNAAFCSRCGTPVEEAS